jgi:hypothetical protein
MYIGLFPTSPPTIGAGEEVVETTGYSVIGVGGAHYVHDAAVNAAYVLANPRTSFLSVDGRGWRLNESEPEVTMFGCLVHASPPSAPVQAANSDAFQTALWSGLPLRLPVGIIWLRPDIMHFPWKAGTAGVSTITGAGRDSSYLRFNTTNAHTKPAFSIPEGYVDGKDNKLYDPTGTVMTSRAGLPGPSGGRHCLWRGFTINVGYGRYGTCLFLTNTVGDLFEDMSFSGANRGYFNPQGFNATLIDVALPGLYYYRLADEENPEDLEVMFEQAFGMFFHNHTNVIQVSGTGWGTTINAGGAGSSVMGARLEVGECALSLGGAAYNWDNWNGTAFSPATRQFSGRVIDVTTESNRWGILARYGSNAKCENIAITGTAGAVPKLCTTCSMRSPAAGLVVYPQFIRNGTFRNLSFGLTGSLYGRAVNSGQVHFEDCAGADVRGLNTIFSATLADPYRLITEMVNRTENGSNPVDRQMISVDSQLVLAGLTQVNLRDELVLARKLGGTVAVANGATFVDVAFPGGLSSGTSFFVSGPTAVVDGSSTLPANTYYYATTLVGKRGEVGVGGFLGLTAGPPRTFVASTTYKSVVVASGERADMTFSGFGASALYRRRVYRGTAVDVFDGFFEMPATTLSFSDNGTVAFTGQDIPPPQNSTIATQHEVDADYIVPAVEVGWDTGWWISNKATTGFRINFHNAAPSATTVGWLIARV